MKLPWMSRADRRLWHSARTLEDLGALTALWLEGKIASQPVYQPWSGPEHETLPLIPTLAAANRSGFFTTDSQPGEHPAPGSRRQILKFDAVQGFIADRPLLEHLLAMADDDGYIAIIHPASGPGDDAEGTVTTVRDGQPVTLFGAYRPRHELRDLYAHGRSPLLHPTAFAELSDAWQVALISPDPGPSHLWHDLHDAVAGDDTQPRCVRCGCTEDRACPGGCYWAPTAAMVDLCSACIAPDDEITNSWTTSRA